MDDRDAADGEESFTLYAGPLSRGSLRAEVLQFCERNGLSCDVAARRDRLLWTRMTFNVRGPSERITALAAYLRWDASSYRTSTTGDVGPI
ncbi:MAG TPA: hypothetical protein VF257_19490 [Solirubrobacteraceae bacterium]